MQKQAYKKISIFASNIHVNRVGEIGASNNGGDYS
jgi:hypothetical protein